MTTKQAQNLLQYLGYYVGNIDGVWGSGSREACKAFQRDRGITVDGYHGPETDKALRYAVGNDLMKLEDVVISEKETTTEDSSAVDTFWDHIRYWSREEFRCRCGGKYCNGFPAEPDQTLVELLDDVREHFGRPGLPSSGLRCKTWNAIQSGVGNSYHMIGKAMDFCIEGHRSAEICAYIRTLQNCKYTYEIDGDYVHVEVY